MPPQVLRDYQARGLGQIVERFRQGARKVLAVAPTGGGKTTVFCHPIAQLAAAGTPSVIMVHRKELATQAASRLREFGTEFGFILGGMPRNPGALVQVASVQSLHRRKKPPAKFIVVDEAHLSTAKTYQAILDEYPDARVLGVTASPWRLGGKPLSGFYDDVVVIATPRELREAGWLCPYVGFSYKHPDLSKIETTGGDYNDKQSAEVMSESLIVDNVVEMWLKHAATLSTVVFAVTVEHSQQLAARFLSAGVKAEHLDGSTPSFQREAILRRVSDGTTRVLCNVGIAVEGLDIPRLKCCVLARPTKSLARAIQMMGRVRRPWNGVTARIHDHAFVIQQHGLPDEDRDYRLSAKRERPPSITRCDECGALYTGTSCPACAHENQTPPGERVLNTVDDAEQVTFDSETTTVKVQLPPVVVKWIAPGRVLEGRLARKWQEQTEYGLRWFYFLEGAKRDYVFNGTTQLDRWLNKVQISEQVRITYVGEERISGDRAMKVFRVEVDDGS